MSSVKPLSKLLSPLSKHNHAKLSSVELLVSQGYIKQAGSGFFDLLPLGLRVQRKITEIVRKHLEKQGCTELELSTLVNPQLWRSSGRLQDSDKENDAGSEFIFTSGKKHLLAPTAEEQITSLVGSVSYRQLPLSLYQITRKYRNELRPREGLLRTREFLMKDLYTFDEDADKAAESYDRIKRAYHGIFDEINVPYLAAEADSGTMGGNLSHEYHYVDSLGEDSVVSCKSCGYAANIEKAVSSGGQSGNPVEVDGAKIPENRTLNPVLLQQAVDDGKLLVDSRIDPEQGTALVEPLAGDHCVNCGHELDISLSIEVGHTFYLGDRYTKPFKANVFPAVGSPRPIEMGCYGIGINRIIGAVASKNMDEFGLVWPKSIAPFHCCVISKEPSLSSEIAHELSKAGIDATYEDRTAQLGQAMRSARESGFPLTILLGKSWEKEGVVEILPRLGESQKASKSQLVSAVKEALSLCT